MKLVKLTKGYFTAVDDDDYSAVMEFKWYALEGIRKGWTKVYAARNANSKSPVTMMHHLILPPPPGLLVDHHDGNGLNNRRYNLRHATPRENVLNKSIHHNRSMKGVSRSRGRWRAYITPHRKQLHLGVFETAAEAMQVYDKAAIEMYGQFALTNFPRENYGEPYEP